MPNKPVVEKEKEDEPGCNEDVPSFIFMNKPGNLPGETLKQIRAHTTRAAYRRKQQKRKRAIPRSYSFVNLRFGSGIDPLRALPRIGLEDEQPGSLEELKHHLFTFFNQTRMKTDIYPHGLQDAGFYTAMLFKAAAHQDAVFNRTSCLATTAMKAATISAIHKNLLDPIKAQSVENLVMICYLVGPCLAEDNETAVQEYLMHRKAYTAIIEKAGGTEVIAKVSNFSHGGLKIIIIHAMAKAYDMPIPGLVSEEDVALIHHESIFGMQSSHTDERLASPLYRVETGQHCSGFQSVKDEQTRNLLLELQHCFSHSVDLHNDRGDAALKISQTLSKIMNDADPPEHSSTAIYATCYWTATIILRLFERRCEWRSAVHGTVIVPHIKALLQMTDLGDLWGSNIGVLYWVLLVLSCASFQTPYFSFFNETLSRLYFHVVYQLDDWRGAKRSMLMMRDLSRLARG